MCMVLRYGCLWPLTCPRWPSKCGPTRLSPSGGGQAAARGQRCSPPRGTGPTSLGGTLSFLRSGCFPDPLRSVLPYVSLRISPCFSTTNGESVRDGVTFHLRPFHSLGRNLILVLIIRGIRNFTLSHYHENQG